MEDYKYACKKYRNKLIKLIKPKQNCIEVLYNDYLLLNIFSYFQSGWFVNKFNDYDNQICIYKDIFGNLVKVHQVTNRIQNPYRDKSVCKRVRENSVYVGPINEWYKTIHGIARFKHK